MRVGALQLALKMQGLAAKAVQKSVEKQVKNTVKDSLPSTKGPKTRGRY